MVFKKKTILSYIENLRNKQNDNSATLCEDDTTSSEKPLDLSQSPIDEIKQAEDILEKIKRKEQSFDSVGELKTEVISLQLDSQVHSIGKRDSTIERTIFSEKEYNNDISSNEVYVKDSLRGRSGRFWSKNEKTYFYSVKENNNFSKTPFTFYFDDNVRILSDSPYYKTRQWVALKVKPELFHNGEKKYSSKLWKSYILGEKYLGSLESKFVTGIDFNPTVRQDILFSDYVYNFDLPFSDLELKNLNTLNGTLHSKVEMQYNFYIKNYEELIAKQEYSEKIVPNIYVINSQLENENPNPTFKNHITLNGKLSTNEKNFNKNSSKEEKTIPSVGEYYDEYTRKLPTISKDEMESIQNKLSNVCVSSEDIKTLSEINERREMFPMFMEISFSTDRTTNFSQMLKETKLSEAFLSLIVDKNNKNINDNLNTENITETIVQTQESNLYKKNQFEQKIKKYWKINDLLKELEEKQDSFNKDNNVFLGEYENDLKDYSSPEYKFYKSLMFLILNNKLKQFIELNSRTYEQIIRGITAYNETVLYRVAKFEGSDTNKIVQNYYFCNSNELEVVNFVDTQVKYNKDYTYVIYAYQFVLGNRYQYSNLKVKEFEEYAAFEVTNEAVPVLVEEEYCRYTNKVFDSPPLSPTVEFVSYRGIDNRVLLTLQSSVGKIDLQPIAIKSTDYDEFRKIRKVQKKEDSEPITFENDDHVSIYEVYRTEFKPQSYDDFKNYLRKVVRTDVSLKTIQSATSAVFVDSIEPNKKYYYTIRSIDNHGHFSNPTNVVEIEMINENGTIFMLQKEVLFEKVEKKKIKDARRFIHLVPNLMQTMINEEKTGYSNAKSAEEVKKKVVLGVQDSPVWDKKFRIRITSKSTGKKIDLRVGFSHENMDN